MPAATLSKPIKAIRGVRLPDHPPGTVWDLTIEGEEDSTERKITSISPHDEGSSQDPELYPLLLPALTHPHIHLDKAFIHNVQENSHLLPRTGSFQEALSLTAQAKEQITWPDVLERGKWLFAESVAAGVTAMRAFVEVDHTVGPMCMLAGRDLVTEWENSCSVQLIAFAQDPIFSGEHGEENRELMEKYITAPSIQGVGTTPYVESSVEAAKENIDWAIKRAWELKKHVDFHLDYNLDQGTDALVWHVLDRLKAKDWTAQSSDKRVMLGHCTRLTLFTRDEWDRLAREIKENDLPVSFVGLPTSDLYMAAPPTPKSGDNSIMSRPQHERPRGTLQVPQMIRDHGLDAVVGVNNVGNAFTPWGSVDPLSLACFGVGVYQAGAKPDAELLYECVSTRARAAIGLDAHCTGRLALKEGDSANFILVYSINETGCEVQRPRRGVAETVWDPPSVLSRDVVSGGRLIEKPIAELRAASSPATTFIYED
ncbi:hypothetical protein ASPZODRAFT_63385 [Penicilliopsis zonata CBS 506.65]|uniref:Amidohydrolase-related domain-containing protein n=1 Tax=Penicilliopsis zonata CBS 506.65 TaxID=1073090 RepID=A0A1L9SK85_9EURO|nr:hypothetical protein ASPZODRAFT_63385 [Penicilliopsis zonata CBS 506.65]OJJ47577.1 hypothetical protein ASPZODRAFT_63385 [Penicilliopsis zonata CBS 506.65]